MADNTDPETRSRVMSRIRGANTKPERELRRKLHEMGHRFTLHHRQKIPGRPDIAWTGRKVAIFVHGCFWHQHGCKDSRRPTSRVEFWNEKLDLNVQRDKRVIELLLRAGWRVAVVWECEIEATEADSLGGTIDQLSCWLRDSTSQLFESAGKNNRFGISSQPSEVKRASPAHDGTEACDS